MSSVRRILDANANRAREALRVMEEAARFLLDDAELSGHIKALRHDLAEALQSLVALPPNRNTPGDVGTALSTPGEQTRESPADVAAAAAKRLSEALRALEEYAKTLPEEASKPTKDATALPTQLEALRYRAYHLEHQLDLALGSTKPQQWRLCVIISQSLCAGGDWRAVARAVLEAGADAVQLREKEVEAGELLARARQLVAIARPHGASVIVNDRPDVALLAGADGVHLGQDDLPVDQARRLVGRQLLLGVSTANREQAQHARRAGADYCGVGPMFPTTTKQKDHIAGPEYLRDYLAHNPLPHLAIGGIGLDNLPQLLEVGVQGIAVSSAICRAADPRQAATAFLEKLARSEQNAARAN